MCVNYGKKLGARDRAHSLANAQYHVCVAMCANE